MYNLIQFCLVISYSIHFLPTHNSLIVDGKSIIQPLHTILHTVPFCSIFFYGFWVTCRNSKLVNWMWFCISIFMTKPVKLEADQIFHNDSTITYYSFSLLIKYIIFLSVNHFKTFNPLRNVFQSSIRLEKSFCDNFVFILVFKLSYHLIQLNEKLIFDAYAVSSMMKCL